MVKVENISKVNVAIPNFKGFEAGEVRKVSEKEAKKLLRNPNIKLVAKPRTVTVKKEGDKNK